MDDDDSATTSRLLEAVQAGDAQQLRSLAATSGATQDELSACLATAVFTSDGAPGSAATLRYLLHMGASPNAQLSVMSVNTVSRLVPLPATMQHLLM